MNAVTHLEKVITGEVSAVTHLEKVIAGETSAVTYTEKVIAGEATPITHLQKVIAGEASPVTHLEHIWAGGSPTPTEHEYTGVVPYSFNADGSPLISWRISGNMSQTGTPTPDNPIMPQGCGELETSGEHSGQYKIPISSAGQTTPVYLGEVQTTRKIKKYEVTGQENWDNSLNPTLFGVSRLFDLEPFISRVTAYCTQYIYNPIQSGLVANMVNGEFALQKFSNAFNIYIRNTDYSTLSEFKSYLQQQYAAGTPVTVWYVLAEPTTGIVNEPLMKIGDYADEVANVATIPTNNGSTTIDVETTVKPSEVYIKWKGV